MSATPHFDKSTATAKSPTILGLLKPNVHTRMAKLYDATTPFQTEAGQTIPEVTVAYETYGKLNAESSNAILVCHALTGDAHAGNTPPLADDPGWWETLIGSGKALDTDRYFVICTNFLGSCYGTTGPVSIQPQSGTPYGPDFPEIEVRDMVRVQRALLAVLGVKRLAAVIGGSLGGMQVLEWALLYPKLVERIIPIATAAQHSAWSIGLNAAARTAITNDPEWQNGAYVDQPQRGLALARMIAMISYRSQPSFQQRFARSAVEPGQLNGSIHHQTGSPPRYSVESYLRYQGVKLVERFDANTYLAITRAMDRHDVAKGRKSLAHALGSIHAKALCVGISSDVLYPPDEQRDIARLIPGATYQEIVSPHGHDAFLIEFEQLGNLLKPFLNH